MTTTIKDGIVETDEPYEASAQPIDPGPGWRLLERGEPLRDSGDEARSRIAFDTDDWEEANGTRLDDIYYYRRCIEAKGAVACVSEPPDESWRELDGLRIDDEGTVTYELARLSAAAWIEKSGRAAFDQSLTQRGIDTCKELIRRLGEHQKTRLPVKVKPPEGQSFVDYRGHLGLQRSDGTGTVLVCDSQERRDRLRALCDGWDELAGVVTHEFDAIVLPTSGKNDIIEIPETVPVAAGTQVQVTLREVKP